AHLEQQSLLRIETHGLARSDAEELRIERVDPIEKRAAARVHLARRMWIAVVVGVHIPPIGGHIRGRVETAAQASPERFRIVCTAREAAADADYRDRFALVQ